MTGSRFGTHAASAASVPRSRRFSVSSQTRPSRTSLRLPNRSSSTFGGQMGDVRAHINRYGRGQKTEWPSAQNPCTPTLHRTAHPLKEANMFYCPYCTGKHELVQQALDCLAQRNGNAAQLAYTTKLVTERQLAYISKLQGDVSYARSLT